MNKSNYACLCCNKPHAQLKLNHYYFCDIECVTAYYKTAIPEKATNLSPNKLICYECKTCLLPEETRFFMIGDDIYTLCKKSTCDIWFSCINCKMPTSLNESILGLINNKFYTYCSESCRERKRCTYCQNLVPLPTQDDYCSNYCRTTDAGIFRCDVCSTTKHLDSRYGYDGEFGDDYYCSLECTQKKEDVVECINCRHPILHADAIDDFFCGLGCKRLFFSKRVKQLNEPPPELAPNQTPIDNYNTKDIKLSKTMISALNSFAKDVGKATEIKNRLLKIGRKRLMQPYPYLKPLEELIPYQLYRYHIKDTIILYITPVAFALHYKCLDTAQTKVETLYSYYHNDSLKDALNHPVIRKIPYLDIFLDILDLRKNIMCWLDTTENLMELSFSRRREHQRKKINSIY